MSAERPSQSPEQQLRNPGPWNIIARRVFVWLFNRNRVAPAEVDIIDNATEKASKLLSEGYSLWILGTHPSKREGIELIARPAHFVPDLVKHPIVMPISLHQYLEHKRLVDFLMRLTAAAIVPVVNEDTVEEANKERVEKKLKRKVKRGLGLRKYSELVKDAYHGGGIAGIAPQGGRRKKLDLSQAHLEPVKFLLDRNKIPRDGKLAFLFNSMVPLSNEDPNKIYESYNFGVNYKVTFFTLTLAQLYDILAKMNELLALNPIEPEKSEITLDELVLIILSLPIGTDYNKINPGYGKLLASIDNTGTVKEMKERGLFLPEVLE